jgi:hypothetical protein
LLSFFKRGLSFYYELDFSLRIEKGHGIYAGIISVCPKKASI